MDGELSRPEAPDEGVKGEEEGHLGKPAAADDAAEGGSARRAHDSARRAHSQSNPLHDEREGCHVASFKSFHPCMHPPATPQHMTTAEEGAAWAVRAGALLGVDFWLGWVGTR